MDDNPNVSTFWTVLDGVINQVDDGLTEHKAIHCGVHWSGGFHQDGLPLFFCQDSQMVDYLACDFCEIHLFKRELHLSSISTGEC
jgi:hypothetical protein